MPVSVFSVVVGLWCVILVLFGGMCISRLGEVCISLGLEHVLWPLCGCGHLCLLVVLCCDASLVDVVWIRAPCVLCLA